MSPGPTTERAEIAILGGGIAGRWILDRLLREGREAVLIDAGGPDLLEQAAAPAQAEHRSQRQTAWSQGILHRGAKYLLRPFAAPTPAAEAFPDLWPRWRRCLSGGDPESRDGASDPDLRGVDLLDQGPRLHSRGDLPAELVERLEAARQRGLVESIDDGSPAGYRFLEPVIDVPGLLRRLAEPHLHSCCWRAAAVASLEAGRGVRVEASGRVVRARWLVLAAGQGNESLLRRLGRARPVMVRRPLCMVRLDGAHLPPTWCHVLDPSAAPGQAGAHLTVTSHRVGPGGPERWFWMVGGDPSEVDRPGAPEDPSDRVRRILARTFPELELGRARWSRVRVDRAEPDPSAHWREGRRRLRPFVDLDGPVLTVWPLKLVLAPLLADRVVETLDEAACEGPGKVPGTSPGQ